MHINFFCTLSIFSAYIIFPNPSSLAERMTLNQRLVCSTLESEVNTSVTTDPRIIPQTNPTVSTPNPVVSTPTDTQATLLALLTQAANHQIP